MIDGATFVAPATMSLGVTEVRSPLRLQEALSGSSRAMPASPAEVRDMLDRLVNTPPA